MNSPHHFLVGENSSNRIHIYIVICLTHMFIFSYKIITYRIIYIYDIFNKWFLHEADKFH